jgi:superfamily I DNA/RNA helicase
MQLLALRLLRYAEEGRSDLRVLYVAHNNAMAEKVRQRFAVLDPSFERFGRGADREIVITTLAAYGLKYLSLPTTSVFDPDAEGSKSFQKEAVAGALQQALAEGSQVARESSLFRLGLSEPIIFDVLAQLVVAEISMAIKGHGLENDRRRYIESERRFSRFHGLLNRAERELVYRAFEIYHKQVFEELEVLDSDDIAISLLGRLRTPIWELKRRKLGFDFVFVDETQLFNENERRVLPMLTNRARAHVAVVLALDEAQDVYSQSSAGLATLGFHDIASESLASIQRSTRAIVRLAFFVIQRSTDLFGPDFPDFTSVAETMVEDNHPLAAPPRIDVVSEETKQTKPMGKFVLKRIRELRKANVRQIAVICHSEMYWDNLIEVFSASDLPLYVVTERGAKLPPEEPLVVLSKPAFIGGQEFDAVVLVGLEQGVVPPRVNDSEALGSAVEQQALREMYVSITRARYRVHIVLSAGVAPTPVLQDAEREGLLTRR